MVCRYRCSTAGGRSHRDRHQLRETLEQPGATAALVTRSQPEVRVAELGRWGIAVDDSAAVRLPTRQLALASGQRPTRSSHRCRCSRAETSPGRDGLARRGVPHACASAGSAQLARSASRSGPAGYRRWDRARAVRTRAAREQERCRYRPADRNTGVVRAARRRTHAARSGTVIVSYRDRQRSKPTLLRAETPQPAIPRKRTIACGAAPERRARWLRRCMRR